MYCVALIILTTCFAVTVSELSIVADKYYVKEGESVVLTCTVPDFVATIVVKQDNNNKALCFSGLACNAPDSDHTVIKSGTTIVTFTILSFVKTRDVGSWLVSYGVSNDSSPINLFAFTDSLESSTNFESSPIIESTSTYFFIQSNAGMSPTDVSQLNTLNIFSFSSAAENFSSSNFTSDRKQTSASFQTENVETIDSTNGLFFMSTTSLEANSVLSSMSLIKNSDSYMTTPEIFTGMIYTAVDSSFSATTDVYPTNAFTETISTVMSSTETLSIVMSSTENISTVMSSTETISTVMSSKENISTAMSSTETVGTSMSSTETISTVMSSTEIISTVMSSTETIGTGMTSFSATNEFYPTNAFTETLSTVMSSTETISTVMSSTETISTGMTSTETVITGMTSTETLSTDMTSTETLSTTSVTPITDANVLTRYLLSDGMPVLQSTFYSFTTYGSPVHQSIESIITSTAMSILSTSISEDAEFSSLFTLKAPYSTNTVLTAVTYESQTSKLVYKNTSDSQLFLSNSELSDTSSTIISEKGDVSTTPLSYSSIMDTVKHTSDFVTTSHFNEQSVSVIQNSFLSSVTIKTLIQTSSVRNNETAKNTYTERHSSLPTTLFSSMTDKITETVSNTYDDKVILLTSSEQMLLVTSSLNTLGSFTSGMENSVLSTESFVKMISRSSNEFATSSSSLDSVTPKYVKTTTPFQHGLSESTKDDIFISAVSGMIGAVIFVVLIAMVISRFIMNRNKSKDEKDDETSNQYGWSDDGGMNSYNKNYTSREYPFNSASSIHLPLPSYESPYFSYANNYKKNWDDNT